MGADDVLRFDEQAVGLGDVRADRGLDADHGPALVLGGHELARQEREDEDGGGEQGRPEDQDQARLAQAAVEHAAVELLEPAELPVDRQADLVPPFPRRLEELRAAGRGQGHGLDVGQQDGTGRG